MSSALTDDRPNKAARAQALTERRAQPIARVGKDRPEAKASRDQAVQFGKRDLRFRPRRSMRGRHAGPLQPNFIACPIHRQE
jgi:hypothetical protein